VKQAETVKRNAALLQKPQPTSGWDALNEVAEAEKEHVDVSVLESLEFNRRICNSEAPVKKALEVAFIPAILGYCLFLAGCWTASGFKPK
jgi:hypothetical protein